MSSTDDNDRGGPETGASRPASPQRERQRRRIWRTTRALAVGGVAATAAFVFAAAHGGGAPAVESTQSQAGDTGSAVPLTSNDDAGGSWDDEDSDSTPSITPSQAAPTLSYAPPVTHSGSS